MNEEELKIAIGCIKVHKGGVAMMNGEVFHMAVVNDKKDIIGTVKCDGDGVSRFYAV